MKYFKIKRALRNVFDGCDVALFRMPSQTAQMVFKTMRDVIPIGGEIVFDPIDSLNNNLSFVYKVSNKIRINYLKEFCLKYEESIKKGFSRNTRNNVEP